METVANRRAVVLLSGGLDSATTLAVARRQGFELFALSFDYGQRHAFELDAARLDAVDEPIADQYLAAGSVLQTGNHAQRRRFSAARGAD